MNTANLQLEGLLMAVASINNALVTSGALSVEDIDRALALTEQTALGDDRLVEDMSPPNRDAIVFPIRLLRLANRMAGRTQAPAFAELTRMVGKTKGRFNE